MELYGGYPPEYHLAGMTPRIPEYTAAFRHYVHRGINQVQLVALFLGDSEIAGEILALRSLFEDESGLQF